MSVTSMQQARRSRGRRTAAAAGMDLAAFITSWQLSLEEPAEPAGRFVPTPTRVGPQRILIAQGMPADVEEVDAEHLRAFLLAEERRTSAPSAAVHFRNLRVFFGWLAREGERTNPNPMDRVDPPKVTKQAKPFFEDEELAALLKTCEGASFQDRRDMAIVRILIDTEELSPAWRTCAMTWTKDAANDVFLTQRRLRIRLKGGDETWVPIGKKAASALDRYLRARARHPEASSPWLWLGHQGHNRAHMTDSGVRVMLGRRGKQAGVQNVHPHRFRRSFADKWLAAAAPQTTSCTSPDGRPTTWCASTPRPAASPVPTTHTSACVRDRI